MSPRPHLNHRRPAHACPFARFGTHTHHDNTWPGCTPTAQAAAIRYHQTRAYTNWRSTTGQHYIVIPLWRHRKGQAQR